MTESTSRGERIRVLQVITRLVRRGASRHVIDLARSLDPGRFEVEILAGRWEPYEGSLWEEAEATGLRLYRVESLQRAISPVADAKAFRAILKIMRRGNYDIVHTHISKSGLLGRLAARRVGVPVVVHTYHGMVGELDGAGPVPRVLRGCERCCARMTDGCIAISQRVSEQLAEARITSPGQCTVIHNGIDLEFYHRRAVGPRPAQLPACSPVIGTVGSLTREKGTEDLLQAAVTLCRDHPDLTVCIVGDGPLRGALEAQAQALGIAERVVFSGVVEDVRPWIGSFDVLVMPSRSEGMPLTLVETMALGCPIVATSVGGIREAVGDAALIVEGGDPVGLAEAVGRALADRALGCRLAQAGIERAQGFALAEMAAKTGAVYEGLLARKRAA